MPSKKKRYTFTYNGKRYNVYASNDIEAGEKIAAKKEQLKKSVPNSNMTLRELYDATIETHVLNQSENSARNTKYMIEHYILSEIGSRKLTEVTQAELQILLNSYKDMSKTTIDYIYGGMRYLFRTARQMKFIEDDPTEFLVKPKGHKKERRALTEKEREAVIEVAKSKRLYYGYLFMILCGCRPSEAWGIKRNDITLNDDKPILHIRGTKTRLSDRFVPVPRELYHLIEKIALSEYVSLSERGNKVDSNLSRRWKGFCYHVNVHLGAKTYRNSLLERPFDGVSPYNLRHEYCTNLARKGVDIRIAQRLMGHSTIRMTADVYTNLDQSYVLEIDELF